jgi:hypothetical protein
MLVGLALKNSILTAFSFVSIFPAHLIYNAYQTHVHLHEYALVLLIERLALGKKAISVILRTAYEVSAQLQEYFAN